MPELDFETSNHQGPSQVLQQERPRIQRLLRPLRAPGGVYAVQGDVETVDELRAVTRTTSIRVLVNSTAATTVRGRWLTIGGVALDYRSRSAAGLTTRLERRPGDRDVRILLAHRPDAVFGLTRGTRVDLTVAGHTHGGQVQLPLIGPLTTASNVPRAVGAGGLHALEGVAST